MKRVVADTNIFVSALAFGGLPLEFIEFARRRSFIVVTSPILLNELEETLRDKFKWSVPAVDDARNGLERFCEVVSTSERIRAVIADPDDDRVLECAVAGRADFIVSGDRHLLSLGTYDGVTILTVRQFMDQLSPTT